MITLSELLDKYVYYAKEGVAFTILSPFLIAAFPFAIIGYAFRIETYEEYLEKSGDDGE